MLRDRSATGVQEPPPAWFLSCSEAEPHAENAGGNRKGRTKEQDLQIPTPEQDPVSLWTTDA